MNLRYETCSATHPAVQGGNFHYSTEVYTSSKPDRITQVTEHCDVSSTLDRLWLRGRLHASRTPESKPSPTVILSETKDLCIP
jgi:hypothetical protein